MTDQPFFVSGPGAGALEALGFPAAEPPAETSFAAGGETATTALVWDVNLPAGRNEAWQTLRRQRLTLDVTQASLADAGRQIAALNPAPRDVAFSAQADGGPDPAAARLLDTMAYFREEAHLSTSFGLGWPRLPEGWHESVAGFRHFATDTIRLLQPTMRIQTRLGGALVAISEVRLDGDLTSHWGAEYGAADAEMHAESVMVTLQSRQALLQLLGEAIAGATTLAGRFALPGGVLLAAPAAFRFIRDIVEQSRALAASERRRQAIRSA